MTQLTFSIEVREYYEPPMETNGMHARLNGPLKVEKKHEQIELFNSITLGDMQYGQTVNVWDLTPKYFYGKQDHLRENGKYLQTLTHTFAANDKKLKVTINPARIKDKDGKEIEYYPGKIEENVELALRKLALEDGGCSINGYYGVVFTFYRLRKLLEETGYRYSHRQITTAITKLAKAQLDYEWEEHGRLMQMPGVSYLYTAGIISDLETQMVDPKARVFAIFSPFVTKAVNELSGRRYNFYRCMQYRNRGAMWLEKRLSQNFLQASKTNTYTVKLSTLVRDSKIGESLPVTRQIQYWQDILQEMTEPEGHDAKAYGADTYPFASFQIEKRYGKSSGKARRVVEDAMIQLHPSEAFSLEMLASNSKLKKITQQVEWAQLKTMTGALPNMPS